MNIDITRLKSAIDEYALIDINYSFKEEELKNSGILKFDNLHVSGYITKRLDNFHIKVNVNGIMVLPCSISLKPTDYPIDFDIDEDFDENMQEILKNVENSIDIFPIIWENILMEIPLRVVNSDLSDVKTEGNGWKLITDKEQRINPELEKLKDLL